MSIYRKLVDYVATDAYPFHMPGHKRRLHMPADPYSIDITEIDGFDNLHHAEGILRQAQEKAAKLYRAERAWYLINGSTCGLLSAISAACRKGDEVLVARNCHKAVYHALYLRELRPVYLYPQVTEMGLQGQILPDMVRDALQKHPGIKAMILTSPTYDGVLSDVKAIAEILHDHGAVLILDQAHGAHFGLAENLPPNGGRLGADLVVVSVHKTLPAFTQTALLLQYGHRVAADAIDEFLDIYETSSPSYLLMAGIEESLRVVWEQGEELFGQLRQNLDRFYETTGTLRHLHVLTAEELAPWAYAFDDSKILILTEGAGMSGAELAEYLRRDYSIELEMASSNYGLALASLMDTAEGFDRLAEALQDLDNRIAGNRHGTTREEDNGRSTVTSIRPGELYLPQKRCFELHEKDLYETSWISPEEAAGHISMAYIYLYPPGTPLVVPGEEISNLLCRQLKAAREAGLEICGLSEDGSLAVKQ